MCARTMQDHTNSLLSQQSAHLELGKTKTARKVVQVDTDRQVDQEPSQRPDDTGAMKIKRATKQQRSNAAQKQADRHRVSKGYRSV